MSEHEEQMPLSAIIFGGAGGIGSAVTRHFLAQGHRVAVVDLLRAEEAECHSVVADVTIPEALDDAYRESVIALGRVDHVISLAGGALPSEFRGIEHGDIETMERSLRLNLLSHIFIVKKAIPYMKAMPGWDRSITVVSSINAVRSYGLPAYSAAKAGLVGLVRATAVELGASGIRINALLPGTVPTPRTLKQPKDFESLKRSTLLGRLTTQEEIAKITHFLAVEATCITGQALVADCGQTIRPASM